MLPAACFASETLHPRPVNLPGGTVTLHFRELPALDFFQLHEALVQNDPAVKTRAMAAVVSASLRNTDGTPALTDADAQRLKSAPLLALFQAARQVSEGDDPAEAGKESGVAAKDGSGTSSP